MTRVKSRIIKVLFSLVLAIVFVCSAFSLNTWGASTTTPQFKFKAKIMGTSCEVYGIHPLKKENVQVALLAVADHKPSEWGSLSSTEMSSHIAYIDQFATGKNGSFCLKFKLMTDRISSTKGFKKIYIAMNATDCSISNYAECDVLAVGGDYTGVPNNSIRVGCDVFEMASPALTDDNVLDSIKNGGNELYFKMGNNWYDLLDDKCVNSNYLVSTNAVPDSKLKSLGWSKWYKSGTSEPIYFK